MRTTLVLAIVVGMAATVHADPAAEALFLEGRQLIAAGRITEACDRFQRSADLESKVGTLLNLGDCREREGLLANAWGAFSDAHSLALRLRDDRSGEAERRAAAIYPRLGHLTITVTGVPDLAITRNGAPVPAATWDTVIPVDPGSHVIEARAPGYKPWSTSVVVSGGAHISAVVPALVRDPDASTPVTPGVAATPAITPPLGRIGFGIALGIEHTPTQDSRIIGGLRFVAGYPAPHGALRGTLFGLHTQFWGENHYRIGFGADYLLAWARGFASAAGAGFGFEFVTYDYEQGSARYNWVALRASPLVVRLAKPRLEIGVHLQLVLAEQAANALVGMIGVDLFVF